MVVCGGGGGVVGFLEEAEIFFVVFVGGVVVLWGFYAEGEGEGGEEEESGEGEQNDESFTTSHCGVCLPPTRTGIVLCFAGEVECEVKLNVEITKID